MKRIKYIVYILLFVGLFFRAETTLYAQKDSLKIGVALSGGGAKGLAHIGFLQALEEAGIHADYLTGVSMGSIVGGMYACGYHPDVIAQEFRKLDYDLLLSDRISEDKVAFDEKPFFRSKLLTFSLHEGKLFSPVGLIQGQYISSMMDYYTWPVNTIKDFSKLPIPFKAVATNVETVKSHLFEKGNLTDVMRASMAVPLAFSPVEIDDSLYLDGGVMRNFAVEELKDMGADIIIGSYTSSDLFAKDDLKSVSNISVQLMSYEGTYVSMEQKKDLDLLISYDFANLNGTDFQAYDSLIRLGYNTAIQYMDELKALAAQQAPRKKQRPVPEIKAKRIDTIVVEGNYLHSDEQIIEYLHLAPGYRITPHIMKDKMTYMYGLFLFDKIDYEVEESERGVKLIIECIEKPANWMNLSLHYDNHYDFGINFDYISRNFLVDNSRFYLDVYLSKFYRLKTAYSLIYGARNQWNTSIGLKLYRDRLPAMLVGQDYNQFNSIDLTSYLDFHYMLNSNSKLGFSFEYEYVEKVPVLQQMELWTKQSFENMNLNLCYHLNNLDHYYFPDRGNEIFAEIRNKNLIDYKLSYADQELDMEMEEDAQELFMNYSIFLRSRFYVPLHRNWVLGWRINGMFSVNQSEILNDYAYIGGVLPYNGKALPLVGFYTNEFVSQNAGGTGISLDYKFSNNWRISLLMDAYLIEEVESKTFDPFYGACLQLGYRSIIGPVKLGITHGVYSSRQLFDPTKYYLSIGYLLD